ncbi:MAG TPA: class I SAM-dependent methyltransferase [Thermoanaerobaculia bacterium]|jgi:SAM-dependent methyltransferase|nr:class I SAM-dependent methyltransferase [Thermoanaerobaculia bacterium]
MRPLFSKHFYWICGCVECGHRSADLRDPSGHVERIYDDEYFAGGGAGYSDYLAEKDLLRQHGRRYGRLLQKYMHRGTVFDVGAAAGFVLQGMVDAGWSGRGLEPNRRMSEHARGELHLQVETGPLESFHTAERFDLVTLIQVIAHLPDVRQACQISSEITRPGGFWLIETWNRASCAARIFGRHWHEYSPPSVVHWFTPKTLRALTGQFGFQEIASGRPAKWLNGAHAVSLLQYKLGGSLAGRALTGAGKLLPRNLPLPYLADDLFWMLLQKQG